jgi:Leucine-rich repeat (LRR) protein
MAVLLAVLLLSSAVAAATAEEAAAAASAAAAVKISLLQGKQLLPRLLGGHAHVAQDELVAAVVLGQGLARREETGWAEPSSRRHARLPPSPRRRQRSLGNWFLKNDDSDITLLRVPDIQTTRQLQEIHNTSTNVSGTTTTLHGCICAESSVVNGAISHYGCGRGIDLTVYGYEDRDWCDTENPQCVGSMGPGTDYCGAVPTANGCICADASTVNGAVSHRGCGRGIDLTVYGYQDRDWCDTVDPHCVGALGPGSDYCGRIATTAACDGIVKQLRGSGARSVVSTDAVTTKWQINCNHGNAAFLTFVSSKIGQVHVSLYNGNSSDALLIAQLASHGMESRPFGATSGTLVIMLEPDVEVPTGAPIAQYWCDKISPELAWGCSDASATNFLNDIDIIDNSICRFDDKSSILAAFEVGPDGYNAWSRLQWDPSNDPCSQWTGITCNNGGRVTVVSIGTDISSLRRNPVDERSSLAFTLGPAVGNLTQLQQLYLHATMLSGTLPGNLGKLIWLQNLWVFRTRISGTMPSSMGQMTSLLRLECYKTDLSGTLPESLERLSRLQRLVTGETEISGSLPAGLGQMSALRAISVHHTRLSGRLPASIEGLRHLTQLQLSHTELAGTIPAAVGAMSAIMYLGLYVTQLSGTIPASIGSLGALAELDLHNASLSGTLPALMNCSKLTSLDVSNNSLKYLPSSLPRSLTHIYLERNPFNSSALQVSRLLQSIPGVHSVNVAFSNVAIILEPVSDSDPRCNGHCIGARMTSPKHCRIGVDALPCRFILRMYDGDDQPAKTGGLIHNLSIRYDNWSAPMVDQHDGTFIATVGPGWIKRQGLHRFHFFHDENEFEPRYDEQTNEVSLAVSFASRVCKSLHAHVDSSDISGYSCVCDAGFISDTGSIDKTNPGCWRRCKAGERLSNGTFTRCECEHAMYNTSETGIIMCAQSGWQDPESVAEIRAVKHNRAMGHVCSPCPSACAECLHGAATLKHGWRLNASSTKMLQDLISKAANGHVQVAYRCPRSTFNGSFCPTLALAGASNVSRCLEGHHGPLCSCCDHTLWQHNGECISCKSASVIQEHFGVSGTVLTILSILMLGSLTAFLASQRQRVKRIKDEGFTNVRIVLGLLQVLSLLREVLDIVFPSQVQVALSYTQLFTVDVQGLVALDCHGFSWYGRWNVAVFGWPILTFSLVIIYWAWLRCRAHDSVRKANAFHSATNLAFFFVMLLYPRVSTSIFSALRCRQLGATFSALETDYSISCSFNDRYLRYRTSAIVMVLTWTIGIPLCLLFMLLRHSQRVRLRWEARRSDTPTFDRLKDNFSLNQVGSIGSMGSEQFQFYGEDDEDDELRENTARDFHQVQMQTVFAFWVDDYRPECYWFEPVDMLRKLCLSGLLQFVGRGTAAQVLVGCSVSLLSFGMQMLVQPYREPEANATKALAEIQIFLAFMISFILRVIPGIKSYEPMSPRFYGWVLIASLLVFLIAAVGLTAALAHRRRKFRVKLTSSISTEFEEGRFELASAASQPGIQAVHEQLANPLSSSPRRRPATPVLT